VVAELRAPWLSGESQSWATILQASHQRAFGRPLLANQPQDPAASATSCQTLFAATACVLAHDGGQDPRLVYVNAAALQLWRRRWEQMVGMPSRLTAPPAERTERASALSQAGRVDAYQGYRGIRIDSQGRRFLIDNARIWTLWDTRGQRCGQAASFTRWWWI